MLTSLLDLSNAARSAASVGDTTTISEAVNEITNRLRQPRRCIEGELHGRKAVDAMLNLALAGERDAWLFDELCNHAESEVRRWGRRRSCTSMTLAQLAERTAASGCRGPLGLYDALGEILVERAEPTFFGIAAALASGDFSMAVSPQAARWVYRASVRHDKEASESADGFVATDWGDVDSSSPAGTSLGFSDDTRPLTVDLGCGFGCGPLIYAQDAELWRGDNLLGCDLSAAGIGYARGVASRWAVDGKCRFARADARGVLRMARDHYPGGIQRVVLSCPTPYAQLDAGGDGGVDGGHGGADAQASAQVQKASGNSQLPSSADDPSFLGHSDVFAEIGDALAPGGLLCLASNVEDVAVTLLDTAERHGFEALTTPPPELGLPLPTGDGKGAVGGAETTLAPRRQQRWHTAGGERAEGACWRLAPQPLPWASETERTYLIEGRPVHRVVCRKL